LSAALVALALLLLVVPSLARLVPLAGALALLSSVGLTVALAVGSGLDNRRVVLWSEALDLARSAPLDGVGVGGFAAALGTRLLDPMMPQVSAEFLTDPRTTALLATAFALPYALIQPILGPVGDALGKRRVIGWCPHR
jgi:O-antigen ligase